MMGKRTKSAFDTVAGNLAALNRAELEELAVMVATLLAPEEDQEEPEPENAQAGEVKGGKRGGGYIEAKMINGYGPYLYLRYRVGKSLRSKYIGKPQAQE